MYVRLLSILQSTALEGDPVIMPKQLHCLEADSKVAKEPLSSGPRPTPAKGFLGKGYSVKEGGRVLMTKAPSPPLSPLPNIVAVWA